MIREISIILIFSIAFIFIASSFLKDYVTSRATIPEIPEDKLIKIREKVENIEKRISEIGGGKICLPSDIDVKTYFARREIIVITEKPTNFWFFKIPPIGIITNLLSSIKEGDKIDIKEKVLMFEHNKGVFYNFTLIFVMIENKNPNCNELGYEVSLTNLPEDFGAFMIPRSSELTNEAVRNLVESYNSCNTISCLFIVTDNFFNKNFTTKDKFIEFTRETISNMPDTVKIFLNPSEGQTKNFGTAVILIPTYDVNFISAGTFTFDFVVRFDGNEIMRKTITFNIV